MSEEKPVQPETTEVIQETPGPVVEKKSKPWLKPLLFSILGIILASGLIFTGIQIGRKQIAPGPQTTPKPTPTLSPEAISTPSPAIEEITWVRKKFDEAWDIEYPEGWATREEGLIEGWLTLIGGYSGVSYELEMGYPITLGYGDEPPADITLDSWVEHELSFLSSSQRAALKITDVTVGGASAKKILNIPEKIYDDSKIRRYSNKLTHMVYIWRRGNKSPSIITIKQISGVFNSEKMEALLDKFIKGIR